MAKIRTSDHPRSIGFPSSFKRSDLEHVLLLLEISSRSKMALDLCSSRSCYIRNHYRRSICRDFCEFVILWVIFFSLHLIAHARDHDHDDGCSAHDNDRSSSLPQFCIEEDDRNRFIPRDHPIFRPSSHPSSNQNIFHGMVRISCFKEDSHDGSASSSSSVSASSVGIETRFADGPSPQIKFSPGSLDWGISILFSPSKIFLTMINDHGDDILIIHKPFSSDPQFHASGSWPLSLKPRESASIAFIFIPRYIGASLSHLVLQTNRGGFIINAKGTAVESPYRFKPILGFQQAPDGTLREFLSLHNPMEDDDLQVEEARARISLSFKNGSSHSVHVICKRENSLSLEGKRFWFNLGEVGSGDFFVGLKPLKKWVISPRSSETLMEISLFSTRERNFSGSIFLKLKSSKLLKEDVAVVPLEAQFRDVGPSDSISPFIDLSLSYNGKRKPTFSLYIRNGEQHPLKLEKILEVNGDPKLFEIKSVEGLLIYPGAVTLVALMEISTSFSLISENQSCKLMALTNHSLSPLIEFLCLDLASSKSTPVYEQSSAEKKRPHMKERGFDELMIDDWRSHATMKNVSVLEEHELNFRVDQSMDHVSRWVKVRNPTQKPVLIQLLIDSDMVVDQCEDVDFLGEDLALTGHGFVAGENAVMEALVQPFVSVDLGPVDFRPIGQCRWRSSAILRNNLSGVEWVILQYAANPLPVNVSQGSEFVGELGFKLGQRPALNSSSSFFCNRLYFKEIFLLLVVTAAAVAGLLRRRNSISRLPEEECKPEFRDLKLGTYKQEAKNNSRSSSPAAKDRSRRRRRKGKNSSTPSSPPSPEISNLNSNRQFETEADLPEISPENKTKARMLLHSASFPGGSRAIAPEARAPGSRIKSEKINAVVDGKSGGGGEEFLYDIWGSNHFCDRLMGRRRTAMAEEAGGESQSFFARDPETVMMMAETPTGTVK